MDWKLNKVPLDKELIKLGSLTPVSFTYESEKRYFGMVPSEVHKVYPEITYYNSKGEIGINYDYFIPVLIRAIQELEEDNTWLLKRVQKLEEAHASESENR